MENKLLDRVARTFSVELPEADSMDEYIDQILPIIRPLSEDLYETANYVDRPWLEFRDDLNFHKAILHFFNEGGEYLRSVDGDVQRGSWRFMESSNKFLIEQGGRTELYDLAFLDAQFFILDKHGDQRRLGHRKYFVMVWEPAGRRLEWRNAMELLFQKYQTNNRSYTLLAMFVLIIITLFLLYSVW